MKRVISRLYLIDSMGFARFTMVVLLILLVTITTYAQWHYMGMKERVVHRLKIHGDTLYAATDNGIYKRTWHTTDTAWIPAGLHGERVVDLAIAGHDRIFAYTYDTATSQFFLYLTLDGGDTYNLFRSDPGTINYYYDNTSSYVDIAPGQTDTVFLLPHWQYTHDGGSTWQNIPFDPTTVGNAIRFVKVNPEKPSEVWIGGENMIFSAILLHSVNAGVSFTQLPTQGFFAGDNCMHDIIADGDDWFVAGEGVVSLTGNQGVLWQEKLNLWDNSYGLYYNSIKFGPANRNSIYITGGAITSFHEIVLLASHDRGLTWDTLTWTPFAGANYYMLTLAVSRGTYDKVFLGGYNGVYLYKDLSTSVPVIPKPEVLVYPNPVRDNIGIRVSELPLSEKITISLYDIRGQRIAKYENLPNASQGVTVPFSHSTGVYVIVVNSGSRILYRGKIIAI